MREQLGDEIAACGDSDKHVRVEAGRGDFGLQAFASLGKPVLVKGQDFHQRPK